MMLMLWLSHARAEAGVVGVGGESMLVDMRDRLRAQAELPPLPPSWGAEVALESAYGDGFAGDFVVASRSTDGRMLEVALVDVSGKGREAGARSLLLSGALGGLLGEMSEGGFLQSANNHLLRLRWAEGFATAVHVAIDLETGEFTIGYAGHPAAAQYAAGSGRWRMLAGGRGPLLGVIERAEFPRESGTIRRGRRARALQRRCHRGTRQGARRRHRPHAGAGRVVHPDRLRRSGATALRPGRRRPR